MKAFLNHSLVLLSITFLPKMFSVDIKSQNLIPKTIQELENNMVKIPSGTFKMGCENDDLDCDWWEKTKQEVQVAEFSIGKYEITQEQWSELMDFNPSEITANKLPVTNFRWEEMIEFIDKLNALTEKKYRLPTEEEWEFASRGRNSDNSNFCGSNEINEVSWYIDNSDSKPHAIGKKMPNSYGLYDMTGNVWDWCLESILYDMNSESGIKRYYTDENGKEIEMHYFFVARGGSFINAKEECCVWSRLRNFPDGRFNNIGFRLAL